MKVCKKCKRKNANKTKICKYCGADVSKVKIIKNTSSPKTKKNNNISVIKPTVPFKIYSSYDIHHTFDLITVKEPKKEKQKTEKTKQEKIKPQEKKQVKERVKDLSNTTVLVFKDGLATTKKEVRKLSDKTKKTVDKVKPKKFKYKPLIVGLILISFLAIGLYFGINIYRSLSSKESSSGHFEKATTEKIFEMKDSINHNGVIYKVVKVESSKGNAYKKPKDGNHFLIVTIHIKNDTDKKVHYTYANWTMTNSKKEEKKRIFTSINVDTALYSGDLVIGGIKTGSIVFEQPINDPKLVLNYYELKTDENGNEVADTAKRVFSVSIKAPNEKDKTSAKANVDVKSESTPAKEEKKS